MNASKRSWRQRTRCFGGCSASSWGSLALATTLRLSAGQSSPQPASVDFGCSLCVAGPVRPSAGISLSARAPATLRYGPARPDVPPAPVEGYTKRPAWFPASSLMCTGRSTRPKCPLTWPSDVHEPDRSRGRFFLPIVPQGMNERRSCDRADRPTGISGSGPPGDPACDGRTDRPTTWPIYSPADGEVIEISLLGHSRRAIRNCDRQRLRGPYTTFMVVNSAEAGALAYLQDRSAGPGGRLNPNIKGPRGRGIRRASGTKPDRLSRCRRARGAWLPGPRGAVSPTPKAIRQ